MRHTVTNCWHSCMQSTKHRMYCKHRQSASGSEWKDQFREKQSKHNLWHNLDNTSALQSFQPPTGMSWFVIIWNHAISQHVIKKFSVSIFQNLQGCVRFLIQYRTNHHSKMVLPHWEWKSIHYGELCICCTELEFMKWDSLFWPGYTHKWRNTLPHAINSRATGATGAVEQLC